MIHLKDDQINKIIESAQKVFINDLKKRVSKISTIVFNSSNKISPEDVYEIRKFFHTIAGTASTLGFNYLANLGKKGESKFEILAENEPVTDADTIKFLLKCISDVIRELNDMEPVNSSDVAQNDNMDYTNLQERGKILIIDDDIAILKLLEGALAKEGYTVYICDDSLSAMDIITGTSPDMVLLDIMMPKCDGYEILDKIKSDTDLSDIQVIFISAKDNVEDRIKGMQAGIDDYIAKPFSIRETILRIEMIFRRTNKYKEKLLKDPLTGAYSRYFLNDRISEELEKFKRSGAVFSIAFLDLDHYKAINDTFGHQTGDFVLKEIISYLYDNLRKGDCIFRYGGEEFIILLPETDELLAYTVIDRLRAEFGKKLLSYGGNQFCITFSAGIKQVGDENVTVAQIISMADEAAYIAKNSGRNKVVCYCTTSKMTNHKKTLLLVDDDSTLLKLLRDRLSEIGYHVIWADNGESAVKLASELIPDAMLLDIVIPDIDGFEVCRRVKENPKTHNVGIVVLSRKNQKDDKENSFKLGADDYITKPFSMAELEKRIMRVVNR